VADNKIVGRSEEKAELNQAMISNRPELICIYGRRRVGKTFLIREFFEKELVFEISGMKNASKQEQLENFRIVLSKKQQINIAKPKNWIQAFDHLATYLSSIKTKKKLVVFLDEFPWLCSQKSGFLAAFENFWNQFCTKKNNLIVVVGGSAASFMIQNVISNKGGLHNRLTRKLKISPFNLSETESFFTSKNHKISRNSLLQLYFALGGIPHYFDLIRKGESPIQAIDRLIFKESGILHNEFIELFESLFTNGKTHIELIKVLCKRANGLTRDEISKSLKLASGGTLTKILIELEEAGFIRSIPYIYRKTKAPTFKLCDNFCFFFLNFEKEIQEQFDFKSMFKQPKYTSWAGYAFENTCQSHILQIKKVMNIGAINSKVASWFGGSNGKKVQIDMIIDRDDNIMNLVECKYTNDEFAITSKYAAELLSKIEVFRSTTKTTKNLHFTFITLNGVAKNSHYDEIVDNELSATALFTGL
jgi:uncharacterized protein